MGGMSKAIVDGMPKRRIEEAAALKQARIDSGACSLLFFFPIHIQLFLSCCLCFCAFLFFCLFVFLFVVISSVCLTRCLTTGQDVIVGVNKYRLKQQPTNESIEVRVIDNSAVREQQIARLKQVKATRNTKEAQQCLERLTQVRETPTSVSLQTLISYLCCVVIYVCVCS